MFKSLERVNEEKTIRVLRIQRDDLPQGIKEIREEKKNEDTEIKIFKTETKRTKKEDGSVQWTTQKDHLKSQVNEILS